MMWSEIYNDCSLNFDPCPCPAAPTYPGFDWQEITYLCGSDISGSECSDWVLWQYACPDGPWFALSDCPGCTAGVPAWTPACDGPTYYQTKWPCNP